MIEPYTGRLGAKDKDDFETAFGSGFRDGSPFKQPYKAFLSAIVGSDLLSGIAFGRMVPANRSIQYPGVWVSTLSISTHETYRSLFTGIRKSDSDLVSNMCRQLVVFCHDKVKSYYDGSTEFDFFRHLRNACGHGNKFTFKPRTTGLPARWRGPEINRQSEGHLAILGLHP